MGTKKFLFFTISEMRISLVSYTNIHLSKTIISNNSSSPKDLYGLIIMIQRLSSLPFNLPRDLILPDTN